MRDDWLYEIQVDRRLDERWLDWFGPAVWFDTVDDLDRVRRSESGTWLCGRFDQSSLHGLLRRLSDLGVGLLSLRRVETADSDPPPITNEENPLTPTLLILRFRYSCTEEDLLERSRRAAGPIADVPGLLWKIWLHDVERHRAGGVYCFEDAAAASSYLDGPIVENLRRLPDLSNFESELFDTRQDLGASTRAPIAALSTGRQS